MYCKNKADFIVKACADQLCYTAYNTCTISSCCNYLKFKSRKESFCPHFYTRHKSRFLHWKIRLESLRNCISQLYAYQRLMHESLYKKIKPTVKWLKPFSVVNSKTWLKISRGWLRGQAPDLQVSFNSVTFHKKQTGAKIGKNLLCGPLNIDINFSNESF